MGNRGGVVERVPSGSRVVDAVHSRVMRKTCPTLRGLICASLMLAAAPAFSQAIAPDLGEAGVFALLGINDIPTSGTVTCTTSSITGDVGTTFTSITDNTCSITGATVAPVSATVTTDFNSAYTALDSANDCTGMPTIPITSETLAPGVYCSPAGTTIGADVVLTLEGTASDVWVFKVGDALTMTGVEMVMAGGAQACNVYWRTANAATLTDSTFKGTILAGTDFTATGGSHEGRGLATDDATITDNQLTFAGCAPPSTITVNKDFSDNNAEGVSVGLTCTSGTISETPLVATESVPAEFVVGAADPGAVCTATEVVPVGYTADQSSCVGVELGGSCTITNTLIPDAAEVITVNKDFSDDNTAVVSIALSCTSGTLTTTPLNAGEGAPAMFTLTGSADGATCTATESSGPVGYIVDASDCASVAPGASCTIVNTLIGNGGGDGPGGPEGVHNIPTLSQWTMLLLASMLLFIGLAVTRRRVK